MRKAKYHTGRGFGIYEDFTDSYGNQVTVQESSAATDWMLWVGSDRGRAHVNRDQAIALRDAIDNWLEDVKEVESEEE